MNAKKFIVMVLLFGLMRICHAAPVSFVQNQAFLMPQAQSSYVNIYPCLGCPCSAMAHASTNCQAQALQEGISLQVSF
ncbi:MAG: hypothetical protein K0S29_899 [Gammaproteobacteria bacterium]|jgi:deoxycytidylate deaminase|nr:hypothetical protein [Gammaproteobacteria bacterium]